MRGLREQSGVRSAQDLERQDAVDEQKSFYSV